MIKEILAQKNLPELLTHNDGTKVTAESWERRRFELIDMLSEYEYGRMPETPEEIKVEETAKTAIAAGNAIRYELKITFPTPNEGEFSFPAILNVPA